MRRRPAPAPRSGDLRLNLGSGPRAVDGWVNVDRSLSLRLERVRPLKVLLGRAGVLAPVHLTRWPTDIVVHDLRKPLPFPTASASAVYSSHALEHLHLSDASALLAECRRVLRPGAVLRLALPDGEQVAARLLERRGQAGSGRAFQRELNMCPEVRPRGLARLRQAVSDSRHRWQPTFDLVQELLLDAGFATVERRSFRRGDLPGLAEVEHREDSLFIEAR